MGMGSVGGKCGASCCNHMGLCGIVILCRRGGDVALPKLLCDFLLMSVTGIQLTTVVGCPAMPPVTGLYSVPSVYPRPTHPDTAKSVHFNTVHNCQQLATAAPRPPPNVDDDDLEGPGLGVSASPTAAVGHSLPASYRSRTAADSTPVVQAQPSTPTATINRHYAVQPRTVYRPPPGLDSSQPVPASGAVPGCPLTSSVNGPQASPRCTVSEDGCVSPAPTTRLRHYCV